MGCDVKEIKETLMVSMERVTSYFLILMLMTVNGSAQTSWEKYAGNPVLSGGSPGEWDELGLIATGTLFDGTTYHIWYSTIDTLTGIGYATSSDGINWTKYAANPVLAIGDSGTWEDFIMGSPSVIFVGNTYHMWYDGTDGTIGIDGTTSRIGYATSPDGFTWTKYAANPIFDVGSPDTWDDESVFNPKVIFKDNTYHMWYSGWDGFNTRIGRATSSDGFNWTKSAGNPVVDIGLIESWDDASVGYPSVLFNGIIYEMWYTGNDSIEVGFPFGVGISAIGYATSPDGITWSKFEENPVLSQGPCCEEWDWISAFLADVIFDGSKYQMWYTGFGISSGGSFESGIGYAVDSATITSVRELKSDIPTAFALEQNFPNPFNPTTSIEFSLSRSGNVSLIIYNISGEEVKRLIDGQMPAGNHSADWDASKISSGIYFYRLQVGDFFQTRKMVLMK